MDKQPTRKEISHERIVETAARAIRRGGYDGVGVADIMKEAGLTHGGFYAHFASRNALLVEALERAGKTSAASIARQTEARKEKGVSPLRALVDSYLSDSHLKATDAGCPVAALVSEMPRQAADVRKASAARVRALVNRVQQALPARASADQAFVIAGTLVGTLQLARAIGSIEQGKAMLAATRKSLLHQYDKA